MKPLFLLLTAVFLLPSIRAAETPPSPDCGVLLPGIGTRSCGMNRMESALNADGHRAVNLPYPSRAMPLGWITGEHPPAQLRQNGGAAASPFYPAAALGSAQPE